MYCHGLALYRQQLLTLLTELISYMRTYMPMHMRRWCSASPPHLGTKLLDEFERQAASRALIAIDSGAKEHQVRAQ